MVQKAHYHTYLNVTKQCVQWRDAKGTKRSGSGIFYLIEGLGFAPFSAAACKKIQRRRRIDESLFFFFSCEEGGRGKNDMKVYEHDLSNEPQKKKASTDGYHVGKRELSCCFTRRRTRRNTTEKGQKSHSQYIAISTWGGGGEGGTMEPSRIPTHTHRRT